VIIFIFLNPGTIKYTINTNSLFLILKQL